MQWKACATQRQSEAPKPGSGAAERARADAQACSQQQASLLHQISTTVQA